MFKKTVIALSLVCLPFTATQASEWVGGFGYSNVADNVGSEDISVGFAYASIGYKVTKPNNNFTLTPEIKYGTGVSNDKIGGVTVKVDNYYSFAVRGQYDYENNMYVYVVPSYAKFDIEASFQSVSSSASDSMFGYGAGVGYKFNDKASVETSYEYFKGTDVVSIGFKYSF